MLEKPAEKAILVALAGSPNVGKSTVFNLLTGLSQHVGNWPGKTVEQKTGLLRRGNLTMNIVDLPGTYSLTANSAEEQIARDYLVQKNPDVVVAVLNAASLERNLYLLAELIELAPRLIIALNMIDIAQQQGMNIDHKALESALNVPVIPIIASKNRGVDEVVSMIEHEYQQPANPARVKHIEYDTDIKKVIDHVEGLLSDEITIPYPRHWAAMKLLEGDVQINRLIRGRVPADCWPLLDSYLRENESAAMSIATLRFEWVAKMMKVAQEHPPIGQVSLTEKIDRFATHPILGLIILIAIMGAVFWLVYSIGIPIQKYLQDNLIAKGQELVYQNLALTPSWFQSLIGSGLLSGVGTVLTFIPILFFFFIAWAILEDIGYTARAAFVTDRFMHLLGLHGKSCLPLVLGFGCNVPAVLGTRIIDSERDRLLTILIAPLVPCIGRMTVVVIIAAAFFGNQAVFVSVGLVLFSLVMLALVGLVMNRFIIRGESSALLMELPLFHVPNPKLIAMVTWQNTLAFIRRAGTVILIVSLIVWLLSELPAGNVNASFLAQIGKALEPLGQLMGLNWQMMVALVSSFIAKENTLATLGVLLGGSGGSFTEQVNGILTPAAALAFLVVQILFIPCVATVAAIRQETGSWRWPAFSIVLQLVLSFSMAILVFQVARLVMK
jgi:ferrous iron transport protein B